MRYENESRTETLLIKTMDQIEPYPIGVDVSNDYQPSPNGGYFVTDNQGVIQEIDHGASILLRTAPRRLVGKLFYSFFVPEEKVALEEHTQAALNTRTVQEWSQTLHLLTGKKVEFLVTLVASRADPGAPVLFRWLIRDLSAHKTGIQPEFNKEALQRAAELLAANEQLAREIENRKKAEDTLLKVQGALEIRVKERTDELNVANEMLQAELSERRKAEIAAEKREQELSALNAATAALLKTLDLEALIGQILDAATKAIPAGEKGMLHLIGKDTGQLEMRAVVGYSDPRIHKFSFAGSKGYVAKSVRERVPLLITDVQTDPSIRYDGTIPEVRAIQSAIVAPLILNDEVLGALSLDSCEKTAFTENDLHLLVSFATTATAAIHNALLHSEVQKLALTDTLTNIYNRRGLFELGRREIERSRRFGRPLSAIMFDMDNFKEINDNYGHGNGDLVLRSVAERLMKNIREVDIMGRYGGDEFTILLPETDLFMACNVAERLRHCVIDTPIEIHNDSISVSISLGVARVIPETADLNELLSRADAAMYTAKQNGRKRVEVA